MLPQVLAAYGVVLTAELLADKLCLTVGVLTLRHRPGVIALGASLALLVKVLAALLLGQALAALPAWLPRAASALSFAALGITLLRAERPPEPEEAQESVAPRGALGAFGAVLLAEWGDPGQLAIVGLCARGQPPPAIACGALLAYATKALVALSLGAFVRARLPGRALRRVALLVCAGTALVLGLG